MEGKKFVVAIDGPAGAGKGTVARLVAQRLGYLYVDTGAMYRAVTWKALRVGADLTDENQLATIAANLSLNFHEGKEGYRVLVDGQDVSEKIRDEEISQKSHYAASSLLVRQVLWAKQRQLRVKHHLVMEGRDIGSIVFPDAQVKIYLDASLKERARRRYLQLKEKGLPADLEAIKKEIALRDERDLHRSIAPLVRLPEAVYLDTTNLTIGEEVEIIVNVCRQRGAPDPSK
ncbi:MAG TPA: (d)CMP kinase [bacterium]|nr:(d)CMP kinase [bacterium]